MCTDKHPVLPAKYKEVKEIQLINLNFNLFDTYVHVFWGVRIFRDTAVFVSCLADLYCLQHKSQSHGNMAMELAKEYL
jgi:hypothetical protein